MKRGTRNTERKARSSHISERFVHFILIRQYNLSPHKLKYSIEPFEH